MACLFKEFIRVLILVRPLAFWLRHSERVAEAGVVGTKCPLVCVTVSIRLIETAGIVRLCVVSTTRAGHLTGIRLDGTRFSSSYDTLRRTGVEN